MIWRHGLLLTLFLALGALAAFYLPSFLGLPPTSWSYSDLRLLDPVDAGPPTHDLLAVYTRYTPSAVQIRLDMLEHAAVPDYDLYLALDTRPDGTHNLPVSDQTELDWDMLLIIPSSGSMQALDSQMQPIAEAGLRVVRDPVLDQVVVSLSQAAFMLSQKTPDLDGLGVHSVTSLNLQVLITPAGSGQVSDRSAPSLAGETPPPPARVLLAFWNTYPAYTPATALRRWNGAHTGPLGGSHGLLHLLRAARDENASLALLDLKYPAWPSALDFTGGTEFVRQLAQDDLLILPEYLPHLGTFDREQLQTLDTAAVKIQQASEDFGLPLSSLRFTQPGYLPVSSGFSLVLADLTQNDLQPGPLAPTYVGRWQIQKTLPIRRYLGQETQAQFDGPSLEVRRVLNQTALAAAEPGGDAVILTLGGDLPASNWGAPAAANATLHYLKSRPWIRILTAQDLQAVKATDSPDIDAEEIRSPPFVVAQDVTAMHEALRLAPANPLTEAAWQAFFALYAPVIPAATELPALRANYLGQVWSLLAAADWAEHPAPLTRCGVDPDRDGRLDCVLASERIYAQFEIESGGLIYLFQRDLTGEVHQLIGPSSQVISGLSEVQSWDLTGGLTADPAVIPGAFYEAGLGYQAVLTRDRLTFTTADRSSQKSFEIQGNGLRVIYRAVRSAHLQIPLLLDPWARFTPGWSANYQVSSSISGWSVILESNTAGPVELEIRSNTTLNLDQFNDAMQLTGRGENPNIDYPRGFFLPFPLIEVGLGAAPGQDTIVDIIFEH